MPCDHWSYLQSTAGLGCRLVGRLIPVRMVPHSIARKQVCPVLFPSQHKDHTPWSAALSTGSHPPYYPPLIIQKELARAKGRESVITVLSLICETLKFIPRTLSYQPWNLHRAKKSEENTASWEKGPACPIHCSNPMPRTVLGLQKYLPNEIGQT